MFKNYLKIALRNLTRYKGYSIINISGFAIGITCCILIFLWVQDELSYDRFHLKLDQLHRVIEKQHYSDGTIFPIARTPYLLGPGLKADFPEITEFSRYTPFWQVLITHENLSFYENEVAFADPSLLAMLTFPILKGDSKTALEDPNSLLISEDMVKKYFPNKDPIGQTLTMDNTMDFKVAGIFKNIPHNSHLKFEFLGQFDKFIKLSGWDDGWNSNNYYTYVQLEKNAFSQQLSEKIQGYFQKINPEWTSTKLLLQSVKDIHLHSDFAIDLGGKSENRAKYVYMFSIVALFVLLIACINFMNLTTARSSGRALEIGVRKVVGANRSHLIRQYLGESILFTLLAFFIALLLVFLLLPAFNNISGKDIGLEAFNNGPVILVLVGLALFTGILSGSYPALFLSGIQPIKALKGALKVGSQNSVLRKALVTLQFALSISLIIGTFVVNNQLNYIQTKNLGYTQDHLIYFAERGSFWKEYDSFKKELLQNPRISAVTAASSIPTHTVTSTSGVNWEGKNPKESFLFTQFNVDFDYFKTFAMEMAQGRSFSREFTTDATSAYILNETGIRLTGMEDPIGKTFTLWGRPGPIVGIVKDYHFKSLHAKIEPLVLRMFRKTFNRYVIIRVGAENITATLKNIENVYNKIHPGYPFEFRFLDEAINELYQSERQTRAVFRAFMFLAIFISCIGLFGLASFMADQRTKEIGIRKILGASSSSIFILLLREFVKWVVIANAVSWPLAYYIMHRWLKNFAYQADIALWMFIISGAIGFIVAIGTVTYQSLKASVANPVDSLRYE